MQKDERGVMMSDPTPGSGRHSATMTPTTAEDPSQRPSGAGRVAWLLLLAGACALAAAIYSGIHSRVAAETNLKQATEEASVATVNVVHPKSDAPTQEIVLPGNTQAFIEAPIYARTNGYLKRWYFDIGAQVKKGELLAEIETPEVDQQLEQARSDLETAKANLELSKTTAARYRALIQSRSVSQQDTDAAVSDLNAKLSMVNSNASNVRRLEEMQSFEKVYAPFDGVVTARNTDIGSLIDAGAATPGKELFHMTEISKLRVYVAVPEIYSRAAQSGAEASLTLDEFPGQIFRGVIVRNSNSIDPASRTLLTEVDVDNPSGKLLPGAYVSVHLKLPEQIRSVTVPANTLLFRSEGLRVAVVRDGRADLVPVTIGRDYGNSVEIVSGLQPTDKVIVDPADSLTSGTQVRINNQQKEGSAQ